MVVVKARQLKYVINVMHQVEVMDGLDRPSLTQSGAMQLVTLTEWEN